MDIEDDIKTFLARGEVKQVARVSGDSGRWLRLLPQLTATATTDATIASIRGHFRGARLCTDSDTPKLK